MKKYKNLIQETFRTYDNPLEEDDSKLIYEYLITFKEYQRVNSIMLKDRSYIVTLKNEENIAYFSFGEGSAILTEYDGFTTAYPLNRIDFIKKEKFDYIGSLNTKSLVYTFDKFNKSVYYDFKHYIGMSREDYYKNKISQNELPEDYRDLSNNQDMLMKIIASTEYANDIKNGEVKIKPKAHKR